MGIGCQQILVKESQSLYYQAIIIIRGHTMSERDIDQHGPGSAMASDKAVEELARIHEANRPKTGQLSESTQAGIYKRTSAEGISSGDIPLNTDPAKLPQREQERDAA
jgi:hypothetical protein